MKLALAVLALAAAVTVASARASTRATIVTVAMSEFKFTLSKNSVPRGAVVFKVKNAGAIGHDFSIAGKKTPIVSPGSSAMLTVRFARAGRYPYLCLVPTHAAAGMTGVLIVR